MLSQRSFALTCKTKNGARRSVFLLSDPCVSLEYKAVEHYAEIGIYGFVILFRCAERYNVYAPVAAAYNLLEFNLPSSLLRKYLILSATVPPSFISLSSIFS